VRCKPFKHNNIRRRLPRRLLFDQGALRLQASGLAATASMHRNDFSSFAYGPENTAAYN
jgi:hypothetical protein